MLHIVDDAIHFSAAQFDELPTTESLEETILTICISVYIGCANTFIFMMAHHLEKSL